MTGRVEAVGSNRVSIQVEESYMNRYGISCYDVMR